MAQTLEEVPNWAKDCDSLGRSARYPWNDWFNGDTWLLAEPKSLRKQGDACNSWEGGDFATYARIFRHTVLRAADRYNVDVFCVIRPAKEYEDKRARMVVKAVNPGDGLPIHNNRRG